MLKVFKYYFAWTDAAQCGDRFAGLIGYQPKAFSDGANILWVIGFSFDTESAAYSAANNMLRHITDIDQHGRIFYSDGVAL